MLTVRPKVAELIFQLYGRPLHPELFQVCHARTIQRGDYQAKIEITGAGHVVTWRCAGQTLTEVAAAAHHPLPQRRRLMNHRLKGHRQDRVLCRGGARYQVRFQLEPVHPEQFWTYQQEIALAGRFGGLFHQFHSSGRMALGGLSCIAVETRQRSLVVHTFHTFPDDCAIVKSQSTFQVP